MDKEDLAVWLTERAAIMEFDGELSREEADRRAIECAEEFLSRLEADHKEIEP